MNSGSGKIYIALCKVDILTSNIETSYWLLAHQNLKLKPKYEWGTLILVKNFLLLVSYIEIEI